MRSIVKIILVLVSVAIAASADSQPRPGGGKPAPGGGSPGGAPASGLIAKIAPEQIAQLFTEAGFQSEVKKGEDGTVVVSTQFWPEVAGGALPFWCTDNKDCLGYIIMAILNESTVDQKWIDAWNQRTVFVPAAMVEGKLVFAMTVTLLSGVTPDYIKNSAVVFKTVVDKSTDFKP